MDFKKLYNQASLQYIKNRKYIEIGLRSINVVQNFARQKYVKGVVSLVETTNAMSKDYYYATDILSRNKGWAQLFNRNEEALSSLFNFSKYPSQNLPMQGTIEFYKLSNTIEIAIHKSQYVYDPPFIFFNINHNSKEEVIDFLVNDLFTSLNNKCVVLCSVPNNDPYNKRDGLNITPYELVNYPSEAASQLVSYLQKSIDLDVPRSVMLYSEPGTGKSCVAAAALQQLGLKTLKINNFNTINNSVIQILIKALKFDAILIDDLDHMHIDNNSAALEFLERVRKQVKVVIATVNSTKPFHKAVLRPGRFDKIIPIHSLDEEVIKKVLGDNLIQYFDKVKNWPIAFINELSISHQLENEMTVDQIIEKLQKRVGTNSKEDTIDLDGNGENADKDVKPTKEEFEAMMQAALKSCG